MDQSTFEMCRYVFVLAGAHEVCIGLFVADVERRRQVYFLAALLDHAKVPFEEPLTHAARTASSIQH